MKIFGTKQLLSISLLICLFTLTGCKILPSEKRISQSPWKTYEEAQQSLDRVIPNITTSTELKFLGYDPSKTANLKILTYLDLIRIFMPNASITLEDIHPEVKKCIQSKDNCRAYELDVEMTDKDRFGNVIPDIFGFRKNTKTTGWRFRALILVRDEKVVYKLSSGQPALNLVEKKSNPLGPFQELDNLLGNSVKSITKF